MSRAFPVLVLILILGALAAAERAVTVAVHKRRRRARERSASQNAIAIGGYIALALPISLLQVRVSLLWTVDLLVLVCGTWSIIFSVVFFGHPEPAGPDKRLM
jgi:hypothetical protein